MESEREISIDMAEDEWSAIMNAPDAAEAHNLSAAARAAVWSAAPHPGGIARWFTCSVAVARELLAWCGAERWAVDDPERSAVLGRAARNIRFALWRAGEGPPPGSIRIET